MATLGVAAVSYVACGGTSVANLMPPPQDAGADAAADASADSPRDTFSPLDLVANLIAPQQ